MEQPQPFAQGPMEEYEMKNRAVISVGDWVITFIILAIPLVNVIMLFVWAFSSSTPVSKSNFAKANLIIWAIIFLLFLLFGTALLGTIGNAYA